MTQVREDKVLEFKALIMSAAILKQLPERRRLEVRPDFIGWVNGVHLPNVGDEWFIAEGEHGLYRVRRIELNDFFAVQLRTVIENTGGGYTELNRRVNEFRDKLPQIFVK